MGHILQQLAISISPLIKFKVEGNSMLPTYKNCDVVLVNKLAYVFSVPKIDHVVVIKNPKGRYIIKRINKVSNDQFFVVGDNTKESTDSRSFGWIGKKDIVGKVTGKISNCSNF